MQAHAADELNSEKKEIYSESFQINLCYYKKYHEPHISATSA